MGVQAVARVERLFTVAAGAFTPRPKVDSAALRLWPRSEPLVTDQEVLPFRRFVVGLFGFRRKQLARGLRELTGAGPEMASEWLTTAGLAQSIRPQEVAPPTFVQLFRSIPASYLPG